MNRPIFRLEKWGIARRPVLNWSRVFLAKSTALEEDSDRVSQLFRDKEISRVLSTITGRFSAIAQDADRKGLVSRVRYLSRLSTRCVPLGWSAATQLVEFSDTKFSSGMEANWSSETRRYSASLDSALVTDAIRALGQGWQSRLRLHVRLNPTVYKSLRGYRFYEPTSSAIKDLFDISEIEYSTAIDLVVRQLQGLENAEMDALVAAIARQTAEPHENCVEFIQGLLDASFLMPAFGVPMAGSLGTEGLQALAENFGDTVAEASALNSAARLVKAVSQSGHQFEPDALNREVGALLGMTNDGWAVDVGAHFPSEVVLPEANLLALETVASELFPHFLRSERPLQKFLERFSAKFGESQVPLMIAADPIAGIDIKETVLDESQTFRPDGILIRAWERAITSNAVEAQLPEQEIAQLRVDANLRFPSSGVIQVEVFPRPETGGLGVHLQGFRSGAKSRFFARFLAAHGLKTRFPEAKLEDTETIVADVVFSSPKRLSNLTLSPPSTKYVILCDDAIPSGDAIPINVSELMMSVLNGRPYLYSPRLNKYVRPQINHPVNAFISNRPVVSLLSYLERHDSLDFEFSWPAALSTVRFLPRVTYKDVVLSLARWRLSEVETKSIANAKSFGSLRDALRELKIPRFFSHGSHDLVITYDAHSISSLTAFQDALKGKRNCVVVESLLNERCLADSAAETPVNQIHIPFETSDAVAEVDVVPPRVSREHAVFSPGENWATIKIYANERALDAVLESVVLPIICSWQGAHQWFYLRYRDPHPHVRLRIYAETMHLWTDVVPNVLKALNSPAAKELVHEVVLERYSREIDRYGSETIEAHEEFFSIDSENAIEFVHFANSRPKLRSRIELGLIGVDVALEALGLNYSERRDAIREAYRALIDRKLAASKFLEWRGNLSAQISGGGDPEVTAVRERMRDRFRKSSSSGKWREMNVGAIIHMSVNRAIGMLPPRDEASSVEVLARVYDGFVRRYEQ